MDVQQPRRPFDKRNLPSFRFLHRPVSGYLLGFPANLFGRIPARSDSRNDGFFKARRTTTLNFIVYSNKKSRFIVGLDGRQLSTTIR